jgi:ABC-type dipeptide/oligopeptide/nickel transport system permease subunit
MEGAHPISDPASSGFDMRVLTERPRFVVARGVWRQHRGKFAVLTLLVIAIASFGARFFATYASDLVGAGNQFEAPSSAHYFGTDELGRDLFSRVLYGGQTSLTVAVAAAALSLLLALPLGLAAGYLGGKVDTVISRIFDSILAFPALLLGLALVAIRGDGLESIVLAVAIVYVPTLGRLIRISVISQRNAEYSISARSLGASDLRLLFRHILPNVYAPLVVQLTIIMADAVLLEAAFSFLGLGISPPTPSWGTLLDAARNYLSQAPWYGIVTGATITLLVLALNALGDSLRVALDPRYMK